MRPKKLFSETMQKQAVSTDTLRKSHGQCQLWSWAAHTLSWRHQDGSIQMHTHMNTRTTQNFHQTVPEKKWESYIHTASNLNSSQSFIGIHLSCQYDSNLHSVFWLPGTGQINVVGFLFLFFFFLLFKAL